MNKYTQSGFTITELIVAIVLFGVSIPAIALLIGTLTQLNDSATDTVLATSIAENKVESLRSKGFNAISNGTVSFTSELPEELPIPRTASYTVSTVDPSLKRASVTISYGGKESKFETYIGELGVGQY